MTETPQEKIRVRVKAWTRPNAYASNYDGASGSKQSVALWRPQLASADADFLYERDELVARARDLTRNDGAAAAAVSRAADLAVGHRFVLAAKPDADALGIDRAVARKLGRAMEREFRAWANDPRKFCDRRRRQTFSGMLTLMARQIAGPEGEGLAVMGYRDEAKRQLSGARYSTTMEVIDPDRLSNPNGLQDSETLRSGIELDEDGAPIAAHVRKAHMLDAGYSPNQWTWERVPFETEWGRPIVLHLMEHERAGQTRGITRFAPIINAFKQLTQLTESELSNAVLNAMFGAFVKTGEDPKSIAESLSTEGLEGANWNDLRAGFYEAAPVLMNGVRLPVLLPGDEVQLNTSPRGTQSYVEFRATFLAMFASAIGVSYEQLSMDFSRTNYSSARAALNEVWRTVGARRELIGQGVASPIYFAVMEEAFDRGYIEIPEGAPAFEDAPAAYCRCFWIGPSLGSVDPVKDRQASQIGIEIGMDTLENVCAEDGKDFEDVLDQLAYEAEAKRERGLAPPNPAIYSVGAPSDQPAPQQPPPPAQPKPPPKQEQARARVRVPARTAA